ncbi:hypothetical protein D3C71_642000 [compost metagenome]
MIDGLTDAAGVGADRLQAGRAGDGQDRAAALDLAAHLLGAGLQQVADAHVA